LRGLGEEAGPEGAEGVLDVALVIALERLQLRALERLAETLVGMQQLPEPDDEAVAVEQESRAATRRQREMPFELDAGEAEHVGDAALEGDGRLQRNVAIHHREAAAGERQVARDADQVLARDGK